MAMNDFNIGFIGGLDGTKSKAKLNQDIDDIKKTLKELELKAKLDPNQVKSLETQLNTLKVNLTDVKFSQSALDGMISQINNALKGIKIPSVNVGGNSGQQIGNNIAQGFKQSATAIESFKKSLSNAGKSSSEIDNIVKKVQLLNVQIDSLRFSESTNGLMNVNVAGLDEFGNKVKITQTLLQDLQTMQWNVSNTTTSVVSTKELERINNAFTDYTAKFAQFKSTNTNILSGLTQPLADFESKLAGLKNGTVSIDEVKNAFKLLGTEASKITENFTGQLSKTDAAIRKLAQGDEIMDKLKASFKGLNNAPKEITKELNSVSKLLQNVKNIESKEGRTANWSEAYRKWADEVDKLQAKLSVLQKQQASMTTPQIFKTSDLRSADIPYMTKVSNTIEKQMGEIQKMANAKGWQNFEVKGIEKADGQIKSLTLTVREADGALKQFEMQRAKLQGSGKAQTGLMQVGDVKIIETASQAQAKLAQQTENANAKLQEQVNKIQHLSDTGHFAKQVSGITVEYNKLSNVSEDLQKDFTRLGQLQQELSEPQIDDSKYREFNTLLEKMSNNMHVLANEQKQAGTYNLRELADPKKITSLSEAVLKFQQNNTRMSHSFKKEFYGIYDKLISDTNLTKKEVLELERQFKKLSLQVRDAGQMGFSFFDKMKNAMLKFGEWGFATSLVTDLGQSIRDGISTVVDLDTALVDLKKTANMSKQELEDFYYAANDVAKQMGVTTKEIIDQASAWSRLGFNTAEAATQMAKLSSQFKLISPGMTSDEAVSGLVSVMKAYGLEVEDVLDGIMSKVNVVGNKFALSNSDIIAMLQDSVSAMAEGNNTLEETIALETAAFEIAQDRSVGNGFKTVALRLRGINEETMELDDSLKTVKGDLYDITGVSVMQDADTYKSTYQILKDMDKVWDNLSDKKQAEALELMFGKQRANVGAAVLQNFEAAEKAMEEMAKSAGNAEAEMAVAMDSVGYKLNELGETGTAVAQNLFSREDMKNVLDVINTLGSGIEWLTDKLGLFGSIAFGGSIFAGFKSVDYLKMPVCPHHI